MGWPRIPNLECVAPYASGSLDAARCVDLFAAAARHLAECNDTIALYGNVGAALRRAGPVDERAVADHQVVFGPTRCGGKGDAGKQDGASDLSHRNFLPEAEQYKGHAESTVAEGPIHVLGFGTVSSHNRTLSPCSHLPGIRCKMKMFNRLGESAGTAHRSPATGSILLDSISV